MEYAIISANSADEVTSSVNLHIRNGWMLRDELKVVMAYTGLGRPLFVQNMIKCDEKEEIELPKNS